MKDFLEGLEVLGVALLIWMIFMVLGGVVTIGITTSLNTKACNNLSTEIGLPTHYTFWNGCFVEVNGQTIPQEKYIYINEINNK